MGVPLNLQPPVGIGRSTSLPVILMITMLSSGTMKSMEGVAHGPSCGNENSSVHSEEVKFQTYVSALPSPVKVTFASYCAFSAVPQVFCAATSVLILRRESNALLISIRSVR